LAPRTATQRGSTTGPYNGEPQREDEKQKISTKKRNLSPYQALIIQTFHLLSTGMFQKQKKKSKTQPKPKLEKKKRKKTKKGKT